MEVIAPESCPSKRYVGGTSGYLCECTNPCKELEVPVEDLQKFLRCPRKYLMAADNIAQDTGLSAYVVGILIRQYGYMTHGEDGCALECIDCGTTGRVEYRESPAQEKMFARCEVCQNRRESAYRSSHA